MQKTIMNMTFVPNEFEVPIELNTEQFRLEPLGPVHNERDHLAWMSSIPHIRTTPGFVNRSWPVAMTIEKNLADIMKHAQDFDQRIGFTYSVLDADEVVGCVYIYPAKKEVYDAEVQSWVTASRVELDVVLWQAVSAWLARAWPFERVLYECR